MPVFAIELSEGKVGLTGHGLAQKLFVLITAEMIR